MRVGTLLKAWIGYLRGVVHASLVKAELSERFPTCRFYTGATVDSRSTLGRYNVIFQNTSIANSSLGDHTYVQKNSSLLNCSVGKFCSIASNVSIGLGRHPVEQVSTHPAFYSATQPIARTYSDADRYDPFEPIKIGNDVWIGHSALIMDGVCIGNGAAIGANAVVTKDVPPYAIVGGVPAKLIRFRFDDDTIRKLAALAWWEMPEDWLRLHAGEFSSPERLLRSLGDHGAVAPTPSRQKN